jgi:monoamine oxidase
MSRTPLFHLVRRSLQLAQHSLRTQQSADEVVQRRQAEVISRRRFLATSASVTAAAALGACVPWQGSVRRPDRPVLILGGGIAGLTAGYRLRQAGVPIRIVEAQNRTGGRMLSLRDFFADGQVAELGGELIDTGHTHIRSLAEEFGIELNDLVLDDPSLQEMWYFHGARRTEAEIVEAFRPLASRIEVELATLTADDVTYRAPAGGERLDGMSIAEWLDGAGVTGWFRTLLDVAYTTEYGLETDRQSALNFLLMIDTEPDPFHIFGESDERFHVRGGNDRITQALAARVEDAIETNTVLEAVRQRSDGTYVCSMRRGATSFEAAASHLVLAIPFTMLREVRLDVDLPPVKRRAIRELGYGTNAKLMIGFSDRVWRSGGICNGSVVTDLPFQLCWETSRLQEGASGILTNFTGGDHGVAIGRGRPAEQADQVVASLERIMPGIAATRAGMKEARMHWPSNPWVRGSYASYLPGQWTAIRGAEGEPVGHLHFAGEHCSLDAQGFMEGGCETGEAAALSILESLGALATAPRRPPARRPVPA